MDTNTSLKILVIVLSTTLAIFLLLSITLVIMLIQITRHIKRISIKAEQIADKAGSVTDFFENATGKLAFGKVVASILESVSNIKGKRK